MYSTFLTVAGLFSLAYGYTKPTTATWGSLLTPDVSHPVTRGQSFKVTWDTTGHATDGVTVSLVLCHGNSNNCVNAPDAIVSGVPAAQKEYQWSVPCSLQPGTQSTDTGYGMLVIVDQTGEFQYSTQFSVLEGSICGASDTSTSTPAGPTSVPAGPTTTPYITSTWSKDIPVSTHAPIPMPYNHTLTYSSAALSTTLYASSVAATTTYPKATPSTSAITSPSPFHGAASRISGGAAALLMAGAAAVLAL